MNKLTLNDLLNKVREYNEEEVEIIKKAYEYADNLHKGQMRQSGDPYITHPLNVAYILADMHADRDTVCAGLLHDTLEDTDITKEDIERDFNSDIAMLVDGFQVFLSESNFLSDDSKDNQIFINKLKNTLPSHLRKVFPNYNFSAKDIDDLCKAELSLSSDDRINMSFMTFVLAKKK